MGNRVFNILKYIIVFLLLYFLNESAAFLVRFDKYLISTIILLLVFILFIIKIIFKKIKILSSKKLLFLFVSTSLILVSMMINNDFYSENFLVLIALLIGFFLSIIFDYKEFLKIFVNIMIFLCIYSLISTYILVPMAMNGKLSLTNIYYSSVNLPYFDLGFSYGVAYTNIVRTMSIFREPGVFQIYILFALYIYLFIHNKKNFIIILLFILTMVSTFSSAGIICIIPLIAYILFSKGIITTKQKIILIFTIILFIICFLLLNNDFLSSKLLYSLNKITDLSNESSKTRYGSIINLIDMSLGKPIFGNSLVNGLLTMYEKYNYYDTNVTGTFFVFMMSFGIPLTIFIIYAFVRFISKTSNNKFMSIIIFISLFLSINSQNIVYSWFLWLVFFYGIGDDAYEKEN